MVYNDPSGHYCTATIDGKASCVPHKSSSNASREINEPPINPDDKLLGQPMENDCPSNFSYTQCFYSGGIIVIDGKLQVDAGQFSELILALYFDLQNRRPVSGYDFQTRRKYDTPFWDSYGERPGEVCFGEDCYYRSEVNYIAQGMWVAASNQSLEEGKFGVLAWKVRGFVIESYSSPIPSENIFYWFKIGYDAYNVINESIYDK